MPHPLASSPAEDLNRGKNLRSGRPVISFGRTLRAGGGGQTMMTQPRSFPAMPTIGRPESYYAKIAQEAENAGDQYAHEAAKVGQYVTLALDESLSWDEKVKYFKHALRRHCRPPEMTTDEDVVRFFSNLAAFV